MAIETLKEFIIVFFFWKLFQGTIRAKVFLFWLKTYFTINVDAKELFAF